jgi:hypothetical protein
LRAFCRQRVDDRAHLGEAVDELLRVPVVPEDVDRIGVEDVGHVRREVLEPDVLVRRAGVGPAHEVAAHVLDLAADRLDQRVEVAVLLLVHVHRHPRPVRLVLERHPLEVRDPLVADEVEQDVREVLRLKSPALPGDVDVRAGALRELHVRTKDCILSGSVNACGVKKIRENSGCSARIFCSMSTTLSSVTPAARLSAE